MKKIFLIILASFVLTSAVPAAEVRTEKTADGWRLLVDGEPFFVRGVCYTPTSIGESSHNDTRRSWTSVDDDEDGRNDFGYQTWVDKNRNNKRDKNEGGIGDFELMRQMGINTIRVYHHVSDDPDLQELNKRSSKMLSGTPPKELLREMHENFGIWVAMGDLLGSYTVGSGALWLEGTDYTNAVQRINMLKSVADMVRTYKDEPYILMWVLGNENNLEAFTHTKANRQAVEYARFVNEAARLIKELDGKHPVAISNGAYGLLEEYAQYAPDVDIFGTNLYTRNGFYELWKKIDKVYDRPVMLTEYGTAHPLVINGELNEEVQARVHRAAIEDITRHRAGGAKPGNAIGGFAFEWVDEWWLNQYPGTQNLNPNSDWHEEYNGIVSMGNGKAGSLMRQLRKVYWMYQEFWQTH